MIELFTTLNWVDYAIVIALLKGAYTGYRSGLLHEFLTLLAYFSAFVCVWRYAPVLGGVLGSSLGFLDSNVSTMLAGLILGIPAILTLKIAVGIILRFMKLGGGLLLGLLGLASGVLRMVFVISACLMVAEFINLSYFYGDVMWTSYLGPRIYPVAPIAFERFANLVPLP